MDFPVSAGCALLEARNCRLHPKEATGWRTRQILRARAQIRAELLSPTANREPKTENP